MQPLKVRSQLKKTDIHTAEAGGCSASEATASAGMKRCVLLYTLLFIGVSVLVLAYFLAGNLSLVLGGDPIIQHLRALDYYGRWLRDLPGYILREHAFPAFSLSIGLGADVLTTLHYYVIGDPLNLLSVFVPSAYTAYLYSVLIFVRMYLAGLVFLWLCFYTGRRDRTSVMAGAFTYVFCSFTIFGGWRHPFFLNPMIYFPLLIIGAEKIRREQRYVLFILSVALSAVSNFYFFYMLAVMMVLYALWRCRTLFGLRRLKEACRYILQLAFGAVTGVLLSAPVLWPVIQAFLSNPRGASGYIYDYRYTDDYYLKFPGSFLTFWAAGDWVYLGFAAAAVIALILLLIRRGRKYPQIKPLKEAFWILTIFLLVPFFGYWMNGGSYVANRWVWAYILLISYIVTVMWGELPSMRKKEQFLCLVVFLVLAVLSLHPWYSVIQKNLLAQIGLGLLCLIVIAAFRHGTQKILLGLLLVGVILNTQFGLVTELGGMAFGYRAYSRVSGEDAEFFDTESAAIRKVEETAAEGAAGLEKDSAFYRYSGKGLTTNSSVQDGVPSTQFYWSLANGYVSEFFEKLGLCYSYGDAFAAFDDRAILNEISGVKYFYTLEKEHVPFGYELLSRQVNEAADKYPIYQNRYTLPLGYVYDSYIPQEEGENLDPAALQEIMLSSAVISAEDDDGNAKELERIPSLAAGLKETAGWSEPGASEKPAEQNESATLNGQMLTRTEQELKITCKAGNVLIDGNTFTVLEDKAKVKIKFDGTEQSETYLWLKNIHFRYDEPALGELLLRQKIRKLIDLTYQNIPERLSFAVKYYCGQDRVMSRSLSWFTPKEKWYVGRNSFLFPSGYQSDVVDTITLTFPVKGVYTFDDLRVFTQPLGDHYVEKAKKLGARTLTNTQLHVSTGSRTMASSRIEGDITLDAPGILCMQIAYSKGWKAYVDGSEVPVLRTNLMYMGTALEAGEHHVVFRYVTPGRNAGILMFLVGLLLLAGGAYHEGKKGVRPNKHNPQNLNNIL